MRLIDNILDIKKLVDEGLSTRKEPLKSILENEIQRNYLFEQLTKQPFKKEDFLFLNAQGGFNADHIPIQSVEIIINGKPRYIYKQWMAAPYLKIVGENVLRTADEEIISELLTIIDSYVRCAIQNRDRGAHTIDNNTIGELILKLPLEYVFSNSHYHFIRERCLEEEFTSVESEIIERFYPRVLLQRNKKVAQQTIRLLFDYQFRDIGFRSVESKVQDYHLKEFVAQYGANSFELLGLKLYRLLFSLVEEIESVDNYSFSTLYIAPLLTELQDNYSEKISISLVEFIKIGFKTLTVSEVFNTLMLLSLYDTPIFSRFSLCLIGLNYHHNQIRKFFWKMENPINQLEAEQELRIVLNQYGKSFTSTERRIFSGWVNNANLLRYKDESNEEYSTRFKDYKNGWYAAVGAELHHKDSIENQIIFHSDENFPEDETRIIYMEIVDIIPFLSSRENWGNYNQHGLIADIKQFPKEKRNELLFHEQSQNFVPEALWALLFGHEMGDENDWTSFFELIEKLTQQERMWDFSVPPREDGFHRSGRVSNYSKDFWKSVVYTVRQAAARRKIESLNISDCRTASVLLMAIEPRCQGVFKILNVGQEYNDAINSLKGSIYDALIEIAVSISVQESKKEFDTEISSFLSSRLLADKIPEELLWIVGGNLPKIGYMDIDWINKYKSQLFESKEGDDLKALKSYLLYANTVYRDLYDILKPYYIAAVPQFKEQSNYTSKLIQHICIASHAEWQYSNTLLAAVFNVANVVHIQEIVKYYGQRNRRSRSTSNLNTQAILTLWERLLLFIADHNIKESEEIAYGLLKWIQNFDQLDEETVGLITKTMDHISSYPFDFTVATYLKDRVEAQPVQVGKILCRGISKSLGSDLTSYEAIGTITKKLYELKITEEADRIVELLVERNIFFLVDEYAKHRQNDIVT